MSMKSLQLQEVTIAGEKIFGDVNEQVKLFGDIDKQVKLFGDIDKQVKVSDAAEEQVHHSGDLDKQVHHSGDVDELRKIWDAVDEQWELKKLEEKGKKQQGRRQKKKMELQVRKEIEKRRKKSAEICELKMTRRGGSPSATQLIQRVTRSPFLRSPALNMLRYSLGVLAEVTSSKRGRSAPTRAKSFPLYKRAKPSVRPPSVPVSSSVTSSLVGGSGKFSRDSFGYPKPSKTGNTDCMILVNTFEETFGDQHGSGKGVWSELGTEVSTNLCQTVVSLASFSGETRSFVCTGLFIEWNGCTTILTSASLVRDPDDETVMVANMKIEVLLPDNQRGEGILQHCNLRYNVALVSVKGYHALHSANILQCQDQHSRHMSVVAIGRSFKSGILMATSGKLVPWSGNFGNSLEYSTCKITKAGIGGPVVDFDGKFVGMNFYDEKMGTPYLSGKMILEALKPFENKWIVVEADTDVNPKRWPVPSPCWCHPKSVSVLRDHGEEDDSRRYRYIRDGVKLIYAVSVKQCSPDLDPDGVKLIYAGGEGHGPFWPPLRSASALLRL